MVGSELRKAAQQLKPILSIGKNGVTEGSLALINRELEQKSLIKIKLLQTAPSEKDALIKAIVSGTKAELVQAVGNVVVLYRKT